MNSNPWLITNNDLSDSKLEYPSIPSMITEEEKKYLYFLGFEYWKGDGHIVEIGPWLGGSTYCLTSGMSMNDRLNDHKVFVFDNFIWRDFMNVRSGLDLKDGEDFLPYFKENLDKFKDYIVPVKASLPDEKIMNDTDALSKRQAPVEEKELIKFNSKDKVEILFIDGAKSWSGTKYLLDQFKDSLTPGMSLLVCQDYKYWGCYWVIIIFELLIDKLELEHILPFNTVSFKLVGEITSGDIDAIPEWEEVNIDIALKKIDDASDRIRHYEGYESSLMVRLNSIKFLAHKGEIGLAHSKLIEYIHKHPTYLSKRVFTPIVNWFNETYKKNIVIKESTHWKLLNLAKRLLKRINLSL